MTIKEEYTNEINDLLVRRQHLETELELVDSDLHDLYKRRDFALYNEWAEHYGIKHGLRHAFTVSQAMREHIEQGYLSEKDKRRYFRQGTRLFIERAYLSEDMVLVRDGELLELFPSAIMVEALKEVK